MKLLKILAIVAGLAAGAGAYAAGNIYEIVPCDKEGVAIAWPVATADNPLKPETTRTIYFKVRLWRTQAMSTAGDTWALNHIGASSKLVDDFYSPLSLGIFVSGKLEYAKYITDVSGGGDVRDFVFGYTLKAGDFALPIRLAGNDGKPVEYGDTSSEYMLINTDKWEIANAGGEKAGFQYDNPNWPGSFTPSYTTGRQFDYTLAKAGFHVQTIDFDPEWESTDFWRIVNAKGVTTQSLPPRLYADAAPEDAVTMHVWSMDDDIVKIEGGREVNDFVIGYDSGTPITKKTTVGDISFGIGKVYANFTLKGGDTVGLWTNLVLSAYDGYTFYKGTGDLVRDFITVPVYVTNALPPTVETKLNIISGVNNTVYASSDYLKPVATVTLSLTETPASAFNVTLKPSFTGDATADNWWDYVYFADVTELGDDGALSEFSESTKKHTVPTVEFSPTKTTATFYLIALRSDARTNRAGHQMKFTPEWTAEPFGDLNSQPAACYIQAFPVVGSMAKGTSTDAPLSVICNDPLALKIQVADTYADVTSTNGYTLTVSLDASGALVDPAPITNLVVGAGGYLYVANADGTPSTTLPTVSYGLSSAGSDPDYFTSSFTLTSPESGLTSDPVAFYVKVVEKTKYRISVTNEGTGDVYTGGTPEFKENDEITFTITLNSPNMLGQTIYAYLEFKTDFDEAAVFEADDEEFVVGMANLEGIPIGQSETVAEGTLRILDNAPTRRLQISKVYFSFDDTIDPDNPKNMVSYDFDTANSVTRIAIDNVEPLLSKIKIGTTSLDPGTIYTTKIPLDSERRFSAVVKDVTADLTATNTTPKDLRFETLWTTWCYQIGDGESVDDYTDEQIPNLQFEQMDPGGEGVTRRGNPNELTFTNTFEVAGIWKVSCQLRDKDTDELSGEYSLYLKVTDAGVSVTQLDNFDENDRSQQLSVTLNYWDNQFAGTVYVALKVKSNAPDSTNPGRLKFNDALLWTNVWTTVDPFELSDSGTVTNAADAAADYYLLSFSSRNQLTQKLSILDADGVNDSFTYNAYVVSAQRNGEEKILPASGKLAASYYAPSETCQVTVFNADPIRDYIRVSPDPEKNTNVWTSAKTIVWTVPYNADVPGDFAADQGLTVSITGDGVINNLTTNIHGMASGSFTPNLGSASGSGEIVMTVTDKDGGYQEWVWRYDLPPTKTIVTTPNGPTGIGNSGVSQKYVNADGRGRGHLYVVGANATSATGFNITWTCTGGTEMPVYGFGYKADSYDNGWLDGGRDQALNANGVLANKATAAAATTGYYNYTGKYGGYEGVYDSYLYAWLIAQPSTDTGAAEWNVTLAPESPSAEAVPASAQLPSDMSGDKQSYVPVKVEAAFAREWLPADNLGDINLDGVPDIFATKYWRDNANLIGRSFNSENDNGVNDMVDLAAYNPDLDKLPGVYTQGGSLSGVSGYNSSYAPVGIDLATRMEIRGFDLGLNDWLVTKSDISFSIDELLAWTNLITSAEGIEKGYATTNEEGVVESTIAADLSIWTPEPGTALYQRMDPTLEDTDGDGYPDGWEYFFWYQAKVWAPSFAWRNAHPDDLDPNGAKLIDAESKKNHVYPGQERAGQHYVFERFTLDNIVKGVEIPFKEVLERFNPCSPYNAEAYAGSKPLRYDFDNDGLSDLEELVIGTNPCHWDTDGDRLCDAWEVMMCLDPLNGSKPVNDDHDFMAYHSTYPRDLVWIDPDTGSDPYAEGTRLYAFDSLEYGLDYAFDLAVSKYVMLRTVTKRCFSFTPKYIDGEPLVYGLEEDIPNSIPIDWIWGFRMVDRVIPEEKTLNEGDVLEVRLRFALVHDQVRDGFGFDPRTGWSNVEGYVSSRWDPNHNSENVNAFDETGLAVNTRPYQAYDEYLLLKYRVDYDIDYSPNTPADGPFDPAKETVWSFLRRKTTNPNYVYPVVSATNDTETVTTNVTASASIAEALAEAFRQAGSDKGPVIDHGADTDHDGVPDGWELYMYRNPNASPAVADEDGLGQGGALDFDGDEISWVDEYAGVDSCNAYKDCESIYRHHPGTAQGWWNKFFPTNPGTMKRFSNSLALLILAGSGNADGADTDLDGIPDNIEGGAWGVVFANADNQWAAELGFVYGSPEDDGLTVCFRGGGMNPCTIDTDLDGIPDGWEMQHAGVPVSLPDLAIVAPRGGDVDYIELDKATFIADGIYTGVSLSNGVYIAGGMDATWKGDAVYDDYDKDPDACLSYDRLLGTRRDVDFDHDGLQNYQEYLIQSLRHFRYDDITTPLMGRQFEEGEYDPASKRVVSPHSQSFGDTAGDTDGTGTGFPVFDASDPGATAANAAEAWNGRSFVYYETVTTGVREVVKVVDPYTGEVETNTIYYTAQKKRFTDGASLVAKHVAAGGTSLQHAWNEEGWRSLGYFAAPRRSWDRAVASNKIVNPIYMWPITGSMVAIETSVGGYASTDPRLADTDGDGMDDFYELYHGLNPILGTSPANAEATSWIGGKSGDIVSAQYWMFNYPFDSRSTFNAWYNEWIYPTYSGLLGREATPPGDAVGMPLQAPQAWDPVLYPWAVGSPRADADGDGIVNDEERIIANVADPVGRHTDPTPLWFTERTTPASYVAQYYMLPSGVFSMPWAPGARDDYQEAALKTRTSVTRTDTTSEQYSLASYTYSFEENEGYDTDGDMTPDSGEVVSKVKPASDPLRFDDPDRRQALYLPGENAYAVSRDNQIRPLSAEDFLKQFTVECWMFPERTDVAQTVVERAVAYEGDSIGTAAYAIRANFRIGIDAQGVVYGMFDNNDSIESGLNSPNSCQFVKGKIVQAGKWTHVALAFDGKALSLYIDGYLVRRAPTGLVPANGVEQIQQNPGTSEAFPAYVYKSMPCALLIGARPKAKNIYALYPYFIENGEHMESFDNVQEYFKGYIDEVRVWDGARTSEQILANYRKAMGYDAAVANRSEVFEVYAQGGTRNNNDGNLTLPPELVLNYGFSTLPGAVNEADVAKVPGGFYSKVLDAAMSDYASNPDIPDIDTAGLYPNLMELKGAAGGWVAGDLLVGWWNDSLVHSTVYDDYHVVPWIKNTVSHLPLMDGGAPDSFLYGEYFGAVYTPASEHGLSKYTFPNSAVPYPATVRGRDAYYRLAQAERRCEQLGSVYSNALVECRFQVRNNFIDSADLVPLGGAFAKTCPQLWDGDVADPWEQTISDANGDGIPDWWEEYARYNYAPNVDPAMAVGWDTLVDYNGTSMKAGLAYAIDIYRGLQPDGSIDPAYAVNTDSDGDSIPDWWENLFGIASQNGDDDADNDGLSNYAEYTVSFGPYPYGMTNGWHFLSPVDAYSTSLEQKVTDYFLRTPKAFDDAARHVHAGEYYGEIFTDHDMMEAWWENMYAPSYASVYAYDADKDSDGDGWDNFSEVRSATWCGTLLSDLITKYLSDQVSLKNYPQPAIGIRFTYPEGNIQDVSGKSVVVRTMTSGRARTDATFTIVAPQAADVGTASHTVGAFIDAETPIRSYLQPGSIVPTSCYVYGVHLSKDGVYYWGLLNDKYTAGTYVGLRTLSRTDGTAVECWYCTGSFEEYVADVRSHGRDNVILDNPDLSWDIIGNALSRDDGRMGDFRIRSAQSALQSVFGTVNFITGEISLDPAPLEDAGLKPAGMLVKVEYVYSIGTEWPQTLWFNNPSSGRVRQGLNTIEAWIDLNGDGLYTAGEPYGIVRNVNVGWHRTAETVIELKDTSTIIPHYLLTDGSSDRSVVKGVAGGVVQTVAEGGEGTDGNIGGLTSKIVVRRTSINGETEYGNKTVPNRTLVSKTYVIDDRSYITEADVLSDDKFDLDWKWLVNDATKLGLAASDIKTAEYEIFQVVTLAGGAVTNISLATFSNTFNSQRPVPVARAPIASAPVYSAAPTFAWTCADETMTAFRLQISTSTNRADVVYDSGVSMLPGRVPLANGVNAHTFTAPFYAGAPVATNGAFVVADGTNYFWRVTEYNAKYNTDGEKFWSSWTPFQMDVGNANRYPKTKTGYGKCGAVVRYFGPNKNDLKGIVVVEAHRSADFTDQPLAQLRADVSQLADETDISTVNAAFAGIEPGEVFLVAYIDANNNGRRDATESWGYANYVGTERLSIYTPRGVTVMDELYLSSEPPKAVIYIEDADVNRNEIPDCLETAVAGSAEVAGDTDKDGLADVDEDGFGTDSSVWDTDGDGMPDGWEALFADLDPNFDDAGEAADGDVMAFAVVDATIVAVQNTSNSVASSYILKAGEKTPVVGDSADGLAFFEIYDYPVATSNEVVNYYGRGAPVVLAAEAGTTNRVVGVTSAKVALVHAQVYDEYGFNAKTAVPGDDSVNTKPFTALDKYLVVRYLESLGICSEEEVNVNGEWSKYTLKPLDADFDGDGIADGWELYVMFGHAKDNAAAFAAGDIVSPWNFDDRFLSFDGGELSLVHEYDGGSAPTDPWNYDTDGDEVSDYYAWLYHLKGDQAGADNDGDGLSNYAEYLVSEVLQIVKLDPDDPTTNDTLDYYKKFGEMYLGEIFADHDRIADDWEARYETGDFDGLMYAARGVYDPDLDLDGDGWSNYAEYRAGTSPEKGTDVGIDNYTLIEHPMPVVEMDVVYNGLADIEGATLTVKAWNEKRDPDALGAPDATWTVTTLYETETATQQNTETGEESREKYIGRMPKGTRTFYLGNGAVKKGSFKLCLKDKNYVEGTIITLGGEQMFYPTKLGNPDEALWFYGIVDDEGKLVTRGGIFAKSHEVGTIDYATGRVTIDFDNEEFTSELMVGDPSQAEGSNSNSGRGNATTTAYHGLNPPACYVKFVWSPVYSMQVCGLHYLSDPTTGRLPEGPTTFTVEYTASDTATAGGSDSTSGGGDLHVTTRRMLYGVVRNVDVGWSGAKFKVGLTDASPVTQRMDLRSGEVDRTDYVPYDDIRVSTESNRFEAVTAVGSPVRVRVVRNAINGYQTAATWGDGMADVIYDKLWYGDGRSLLSELDFIGNGMFDIDWTDTFTNKVASLSGQTCGTDGAAGNVEQVIGAETSVTNMEYLVVIGDGEPNWSRAASTNVVYGFAEKIVRRFDRVRATAVPTSSLFTQYSARPTFTWRMNGEEELVKRFGSSYTAFKLQVRKGGTVIYESPMLRAPATDANGNFSWTAPICAGAMLTSGSLFETAGATYSWRVTMYNAKFRSDAWSAPSDFVMAVNNQQEVNDHGYSSIGVAVKYAGPSIVLGKCADMTTAKGKVVVQAFATPDFSGEPLAAGIATSDVAELATVERNAWIKGLPAIGTYYVRAFIDMDGEGDLDEWEPWGYAPDAVTLVNDGTMVKAPVVSIWIDDSDSDRDWLPDAWEYADNGWTGDWDKVKGIQTPEHMGDGGIDLTIPLASIVNNGAAISRGLPGASLTVLQSPGFVSTVLGLSVAETNTIDAINAAVKAKIATNSVKIVSFALEPDRSSVNITVGAEVASGIAGSIVPKLYKFDGAGEVNVKVKVFKKDSLDEATWTEYYTSTDSVTLTSETTGTVKVPLDPTLDLTSGFFRIELIDE